MSTHVECSQADLPRAYTGDEEAIFRYPATLVRAKWRNDQIRNQKKDDIDSSWRREQLAPTVDFNKQSSFMQLDCVCREVDDASYGFTCNLGNKFSAAKSCFESCRNDCAIQPLPSDISIPCLSGWLVKRSKARFLGLTIGRGWRRCWFVAVMVADGLKLSRYDKEPFTTPTKSFVLNTNAEHCAIADTALDGAGRFCFSVSVACIGERMVLGAASQQQAEQWKSTLNTVSSTIRVSTSMLKAEKEVQPSPQQSQLFSFRRVFLEGLWSHFHVRVHLSSISTACQRLTNSRRRQALLPCPFHGRLRARRTGAGDDGAMVLPLCPDPKCSQCDAAGRGTACCT